MDVMRKAVLATTAVSVLGLAIALGVPVPGEREGPTGSDCRLMAQALGEAFASVTVVASDRTCDWRRLGLRRAVDEDTLPPYDGTNFVGVDSVERLEYSHLGTRAHVDVGTQLAELAGEGDRCTYQRLFGRWVRAGCEPSWIS